MERGRKCGMERGRKSGRVRGMKSGRVRGMEGKKRIILNLIRLAEAGFLWKIEISKWWLGNDFRKNFVFFDCENSRMI